MSTGDVARATSRLAQTAAATSVTTDVITKIETTTGSATQYVLSTGSTAIAVEAPTAYATGDRVLVVKAGRGRYIVGRVVET